MRPIEYTLSDAMVEIRSLNEIMEIHEENENEYFDQINAALEFIDTHYAELGEWAPRLIRILQHRTEGANETGSGKAKGRAGGGGGLDGEEMGGVEEGRGGVEEGERGVCGGRGGAAGASGSEGGGK